MRRSCPRCARPVLPIEENCSRCGERLQSGAEAAARRRLWDAMPPAEREAAEQAVRREAGEAEEARRFFLRTAATAPAVAATFSAVVAGLTIPATPRVVPVLLAGFLGAVSGYLLYRLRPSMTGGMLFLGWVYPVVLAATYAMGIYNPAATEFAAVGMFIAHMGGAGTGLAAGALLAQHLEDRRGREI